MSKASLALAELQRMPEYVRLTGKQKALVDAFVANEHDRVTAYQVTHPTCTVRDSAEKGAHKVFSAPAMRAVLDVYFQVDALDAVKEQIRRAMLDRHLTTAQASMVRLYAAAHGISVDSPMEPPAAAPMSAPAPQAPAAARTPRDPRIPEGAVALRDSAGVIRGYKTAEGQKVRFADVEVAQ